MGDLIVITAVLVALAISAWSLLWRHRWMRAEELIASSALPKGFEPVAEDRINVVLVEPATGRRIARVRARHGSKRPALYVLDLTIPKARNESGDDVDAGAEHVSVGAVGRADQEG
jgi:hypothetical protein